MNKRQAARAVTKEKALKAAREAFTVKDYHSVTVRDLARDMGMSIGAIFSVFEDKADLWRAAMNMPVPADNSLTRSAYLLLGHLKQAATALEHARYSELPMAAKCREVIALAEAPLDGELWRRHLAATSGDAPHAAPEQDAPPLPSESNGGASA